MHTMQLGILFFSTIVVCASIRCAHGARILGLFPFPMKSHSIMINAILRELSRRGHQLDVVTNYPLPKNTPNYKAYEITPMFNFWEEIMGQMNLPGIFEMHDVSFRSTKQLLNISGISTTEYALRHPSVQRLIHSTDKQYDLILAEQFYQEAFLMFAHKFNAPIVCISTFGSAFFFDGMFGSFGPWAHVGHELLKLPDNMNFVQRLENVATTLLDNYIRAFEYMPQQQELADRIFSHLPEPRPTVDKLQKSISVMLQNTHLPLMSIRPTVPGMIDVGGLHITPPKELPVDLKQFMDNASNGVIYFSFGTQVQSSEMPDQQLSAFITVFRELAQFKVLWKWNSANATGLPGNVLAKKWLPQNDILAHPNVKLFISHGGLFGSQEAVHYGVPMLGIPFYGDQHLNLHKAVVAGFALKLNFNNITTESLRWALHELLNNPRFASKAEEGSLIFRDRPEPAIERAMYWIEYVIRFNGTAHLRSLGRDLSWHQYFLLDIIGLFLAIFVMLFCTLGCMYKHMFRGRNFWVASPLKKNQ